MTSNIYRTALDLRVSRLAILLLPLRNHNKQFSSVNWIPWFSSRDSERGSPMTMIGVTFVGSPGKSLSITEEENRRRNMLDIFVVDKCDTLTMPMTTRKEMRAETKKCSTVFHNENTIDLRRSSSRICRYSNTECWGWSEPGPNECDRFPRTLAKECCLAFVENCSNLNHHQMRIPSDTRSHRHVCDRKHLVVVRLRRRHDRSSVEQLCEKDVSEQRHLLAYVFDLTSLQEWHQHTAGDRRGWRVFVWWWQCVLYLYKYRCLHMNQWNLFSPAAVALLFSDLLTSEKGQNARVGMQDKYNYGRLNLFIHYVSLVCVLKCKGVKGITRTI